MAKSNLTKMANISTSIREIDFVTRFAKNWEKEKYGLRGKAFLIPFSLFVFCSVGEFPLL